VIDRGDRTSRVSRPSTDRKPSTSPPLTSTSLLPHRQPASTTPAPDVRRSSRRSAEDGGLGEEPVVDQGTSVPPRQASTEASDPSRHRHCRRRSAERPRGSSVTDDEPVDVEDLSVVDAGIEDCLVTSLRAEVRRPVSYDNFSTHVAEKQNFNCKPNKKKRIL